MLDYQPLYMEGATDPEKGAEACYIGGNIIIYISYLMCF
jgi:hypothetical protein